MTRLFVPGECGLRGEPRGTPIDRLMQWSHREHSSKRERAHDHGHGQLRGSLVVLVGNIVAGFDGDRLVLARALR